MFKPRPFVLLAAAAIALLLSHSAFCQTSGSNTSPLSGKLRNGDVERWLSAGRADGWTFASNGGGRLQADASNPAEGQYSAHIDTTAGTASAEQFTNLMQTIDATNYRGTKLRYRAAVRTADSAASTRVQLWCRVDRKADADGRPQVGAFDNMQNRPIRSDNWQHFEIVLPIAEDAERISLGVLVIGHGKAWFDDATLETAANARTTELTATPLTGGRPALPPMLRKALAEAEDSPPQPFFTPWLWLALVTIVLSALAMLGPLPVPTTNPALTPESDRAIGHLRKFSLRFAVVYWGLYCIADMFSTVPWLGPPLRLWHTLANSRIAHEIAHRCFGIEGELVPPNGSGDTTYSYISLLAIFVLAMASAVLWSIVDRRRTGYASTRDVLRSYLRYALALSMLGYGLAKVSLEMNQFPLLSTYHLDRTWGATSPMGVLWSFMGASRPYTIFAGLGEVVAALLLIWRRTTVLGAMIAFGVMLNVMMLNYCYDVPVKIYSTHLVVASLMIILPESPRLSNVLILNRPAPAIFLSGIWGSGRLAWARAGIKLIVIGYLFALPLSMHAWRISREFAAAANTSAAKVAGTAPTSAHQAPNAAAAKKHRLTSRGFRWINEVPFNR